ncbi:MAG: OmpA family protein [Ignavibacteria bacterium]|nr:OmpA family protein [Ignavibacteria bacterium]
MGISHSVFAQGSFIPERFTNRPLTLFNDATSVGWNPALLGIGTNSDLVLVLPYTRNFAYDKQIGGFYSQDGVGFGLVSDRSAQANSPYIPFSFYWGLGFNIIENNTWLGGAFRYSEFGTSSIRFNGSLIHKPINQVLVSAGITNFNSINSDELTYNFTMAYSLTDWLTLLGRYQVTSDTLLFSGEQRSAEIGVNAHTRNNMLTTSFTVNPVLREARFGIELSFGVFSLGLLNDASTLNTPRGRFSGGNLLLRINPDYHEHGTVDVDDPCTTVSCTYPGCQGRKCTRAQYPAYQCIRVNCPGRPCKDNCFGPYCHINIDCQPRCLICFHPIIFNWNVNIFINNSCIFCSCTHYSHYYFYFYKYVYIENDCKNCPHDPLTCNHKCPLCDLKCPPCDHKCPTCDHKCPPCPPALPCPKDTIFIEKIIVIHDTIIIHDTIQDTCIEKKPIVIEGCEFPYNECDPFDACLPKIQVVIDYLLSHPDTCVNIVAHTDNIGTEEDNLELSKCRADAIARIMIEGGVEESRITAIGMGECCPIAPNSTPEGRQRNRRVEYQFKPCSWDEEY